MVRDGDSGMVSRVNWADTGGGSDGDDLGIDPDKQRNLLGNHGGGDGPSPLRRIMMGVIVVVGVALIALCLFIGFSGGNDDDDSVNDSSKSLSDADVSQIQELGNNFLVKDGNFGVLRLDELLKSSFGYKLYNDYQLWAGTDARQAFPKEYESYILPRFTVVKSLESPDGDAPAMLTEDSPLRNLNKKYEQADINDMRKYVLDINSIVPGSINTDKVKVNNHGDMTVDVGYRFTSTVTGTTRGPAAYDEQGNVYADDLCSQGGAPDCPVEPKHPMMLDPITDTKQYDMNITITFVKTDDKTWQVQDISGKDWEENGWVLATSPTVDNDNTNKTTITDGSL